MSAMATPAVAARPACAACPRGARPRYDRHRRRRRLACWSPSSRSSAAIGAAARRERRPPHRAPGVARLSPADTGAVGERSASAAPRPGAAGPRTVRRPGHAPAGRAPRRLRPRPSAKVDADAPPEVPADSGTGRRVVFDMGDQRVWLVTRAAAARRRPAHLPRLRQRHRQPGPGHLRGLLPVAARQGRRRLRDDEVHGALHPRRQRRHRLPRHPGPGRPTGCRPAPSSARRGRTGASGSGGPTPGRCGASRRWARRSSSSPDPARSAVRRGASLRA